MAGERVERRLAAVLALDVAGYSRLMGVDEVGTLTALKGLRREIVDPAIDDHKGRIVKTTGDGMLVEFASAVDAVTCAMDVQAKMADRNGSVGQAISFRIGINVGDIIIDGNDIFGDGVNVAARVENECQPGGVCLSGSAFEQVRDKTSFAFDDLGEKSLKNIDRPVRLYAARIATASQIANASSRSDDRKPLPLPDKPSIAVLPFQNMSGDPEQEYFADGVVDDIITALSRFKSLFVIARNSSFAYKGRSPDIRQVGRDLGVRYVLEGSVRRAGNRLRITAQLIDARSGVHVWADRFEGAAEDIFKLQDDVTEKVVIATAPRVEQTEIIKALSRSSSGSADAYDFYLKGLARVSSSLTVERMDEALDLFTKATDLDPNFASAYALAMTYRANRLTSRSVKDATREKDEIFRLWQIVARVGHDDGRALSGAAYAVALILKDLPSARELIARAIELNPHLAKAYEHGGWISLWSGYPERAIEQLSRARRLDPASESFLSPMAHAHFFLERYEEALELGQRILRRHPDSHGSLRIAAASAAFSGRIEMAHELAGRLLKVDRAFCVSQLSQFLGPYQRPEFPEKYAEGLRLAGLPE